jgi:hypothetical protein
MRRRVGQRGDRFLERCRRAVPCTCLAPSAHLPRLRGKYQASDSSRKIQSRILGGASERK